MCVCFSFPLSGLQLCVAICLSLKVYKTKSGMVISLRYVFVGFGFFLSYSFKLFPYIVSKTDFLQHSNSASQVYFGANVKVKKLFLCMQNMLTKYKN